MTKSEFFAQLQTKNPGLTRQVLAQVLDSVSQITTEGLKAEGEVTIPGLAKFKAVKKAATAERQGVNPFTKQAVTIPAKPASIKVKVSPAKAIKDSMV